MTLDAVIFNVFDCLLSYFENYYLSPDHPNFFQATQSLGQCVVVFSGTVHLVKDNSELNQTAIAPWCHCLELHENSV